MKNIFLLAFLISSMSTAQNRDHSIDVLVNEMCTNFKENKNLTDSTRIKILNEKFIWPTLKNQSENNASEIGNQIYFRLQKNCQEFREYLYRVDPPKDDNWMRLDAKPSIEITDKQIETFEKTSKFYYYEYAGEITKVQTDNKYWTETFLDGTFSKLKYNWITTNSFELIFVESNNKTRKNFSKKGDRYNYQVISKEDNYYWVLVEIPNQSELLKFKLFTED